MKEEKKGESMTDAMTFLEELEKKWAEQDARDAGIQDLSNSGSSPGFEPGGSGSTPDRSASERDFRKVDRYDKEEYRDVAIMEINETGLWVEYEDYKEAVDEIDRLKGCLKQTQDWLDKFTDDLSKSNVKRLELEQRVKELEDEDKRDYAGMREFQYKFINCDHELRDLQKRVIELEGQLLETNQMNMELSDSLARVTELSGEWKSQCERAEKQMAEYRANMKEACDRVLKTYGDESDAQRS